MLVWKIYTGTAFLKWHVKQSWQYEGKMRGRQKGKWKAYILSRGGSITIRNGDLAEIIEVPLFRGREDLDNVIRKKNEKLTEANKE